MGRRREKGRNESARCAHEVAWRAFNARGLGYPGARISGIGSLALEPRGDLPIEQATKIEFVVNAGTAGRIGLTLPPAIVLHADRVIE